MEITKKLKIDFINGNYNNSVYAVQGDIKSRYLEIQLLNNGLPLDISNNTVRVYAVKPDNTKIFNNLTIDDASTGVVKMELTSQFLAVSGNVNCEITLYGSDGSILSTDTFVVNVLRTLKADNVIESHDEFNAIGDLSNIIIVSATQPATNLAKIWVKKI